MQSIQVLKPPSNQAYYVGVDVGTGSARSCIINEQGDILAVASEPIKLWNYKTGYYEQSTTDIWRAICKTIRQCVQETSIAPETIRGIGFDATCSLAVFSLDTDKPVAVTGPDFGNADGNDRNVVLWLDHRPEEETRTINATQHNLLRYVGGTMSIEMEIPKVLWLKNNMPEDVFANCSFFDLADALTHIATGKETRSFCSAVCKQGYVPVGIDGSVKGWQEDFLTSIGLQDLCEDNFKRMGGVDRVNGHFLTAGELVGTLSEKAAEELGLHTGVAVGSGVIDAYAGWIGTVGAKIDLAESSLKDGAAENDVSQAFTRLAAVAGTSTCHLAMSREPVFVNGVWGPYRDVLIPDYYMAEGGQSATGELIKHVIETHPAYAEAQAQAASANTIIYDHLNSHLRDMARASPASGGRIAWLARHLFFYGDLFGNRSPIADPHMRGAITGLSADRSSDALALHYYGALEFIALQTRQIVERMNAAGHVIQSIFMSGSLCQNEVLMELMSTACGMPVLVPEYVHAAVVHGAAMLGAKAASHAAAAAAAAAATTDKTAEGAPQSGESLWSVMTRMSKPGRAVHPTEDPVLTRLLEAKYRVFLEQCEQQQRWRREVDAALA